MLTDVNMAILALKRRNFIAKFSWSYMSHIFIFMSVRAWPALDPGIEQVQLNSKVSERWKDPTIHIKKERHINRKGESERWQI